MSNEKLEFPGPGVIPAQEDKRVTFIGFLGREARTGTWEELSNGTFKHAVTAAENGDWNGASELVGASLLEAQELREVYERWPNDIVDWLRGQGAREADISFELERLENLIGTAAMNGIERAWPRYAESARRAEIALKQHDPESIKLIENTRSIWLEIHDDAVDRVSGFVSAAVSICGEASLASLWDYLLADWYEIHAQRYDLANQDWNISVHQLLISIVDGFHAHLAGADRQGDMQVIREEDRIGFRFAPCGSGGRSVAPEITAGSPRAGHPFNFSVTSKPYDWSWNKVGICSYCVHCCLLNEIMPIDRLGYPTRVVDPPVWTEDQTATHCTWWVYRHPSLVPDEVYRRVGRSPSRRPRKEIKASRRQLND